MDTEREVIRRCQAHDTPEILQIVNAAAQRYRGIIPDDRWRDPYMSIDECTREIAAGVEFWGLGGPLGLIGVMGLQPVKDADLVRHAYVAPSHQGRGVGGRLLTFLCARTSRPMLVGTWSAADWAIGFYERHGFARVDPSETPRLLRTYWSVSERQIETSVVLAKGLAL